MRAYGEDVEDSDIAELLKKADFDKDGELSFEDFYTYLVRKGRIGRNGGPPGGSASAGRSIPGVTRARIGEN